MTQYLVITCPACGQPRVAEKGRKTTQCPRCSKRIDLSKCLVHAETDSAAQARDAVGQINAQRAGGELVRGPEPSVQRVGDELDEALTEARTVTAQAERVRLAAQGLTDRFETFSEQQWVEAMDRLDVPEPKAHQHLERLVRGNHVAQPTRGQYLWVG